MTSTYPYADDHRHCVHINKRPHIEGTYGGLKLFGPTLANARLFNLTFEGALVVKAKYPTASGVGRILIPGDRRGTIDLDNAFDASGELTELAQMALELIPAWWERSIGGNGLHGYTDEEPPVGWHNFAGLEVYPSHAPRFMTVTRDHFQTKVSIETIGLTSALEILDKFRPEPAFYDGLVEGRWRRVADNVPTPEGEGHFTERSWFKHCAAVGHPIETAISIMLRYERTGNFVGRRKLRGRVETKRQAEGAYKSVREWLEGEQ